uniref:aspartic proteinase 36-like n=1 Tax=Erigeron canadensis TaxID=72917 RepID=UPI001CB98F78|nr:aspartic proteinase 36-like [Erigeron canadensis]
MGFVVLMYLSLWVSGNVVFQVQHKFTGTTESLTGFKAHDSFRHRRILSAVDLPIGGDGSPISMALYFTKIQIGTPPRDYHVQVDTGSDLLWVNCAGCDSCPRRSDLGIPLSLYNPMLSSSSRIMTCDQDFCPSSIISSSNDCIMGMRCPYVVRYGDGSQTKGYFVRDIVQLDRVSGNRQTVNMKGSFEFGCGSRQSGGLGESQQALDGILGFGQSNSSILSQLALAKKVKKTFSHCLAGSRGGIYAIGEVVHPKVDTTPILPNKAHYNAELLAIQVGGDFVNLPFSMNTPSRRGTIIDSGTTLAYFPDGIYNQLMNKIMASQPNEEIYIVDHQFKCYKYRGNVDDGFPIVTFHFANLLKLKVKPSQYLFQVQSKKWCIGFMSNGVQPDVTLLGDLVLTDRLVTYNMEDQTIGWTDYDCSSSIKVKDEESGLVYEVGGHDISGAGRTHSSAFLWMVFIIVTKMAMY